MRACHLQNIDLRKNILPNTGAWASSHPSLITDNVNNQTSYITYKTILNGSHSNVIKMIYHEDIAALLHYHGI